MANVFRLADISGNVIADLWNGTLMLRDLTREQSGPEPAVDWVNARFGAQPTFRFYNVVTEVFDLIAQTGIANVLTGVNAIEAGLEKARLWHEDTLQGVSVWLESSANGEPAKRALIYNGMLSYAADLEGASVFNPSAIVGRMALSRHPLFENVSPVSNDYNGLSSLGGKSVAIANTGTAPARISSLSLRGVNGGGGPLWRIWAGIRPTYNGTSGYVPVWEMEAGLQYNSSAIASEAGVSPSGSSTNNKVRTNFGAGGAGLLKRADINALSVTGISPNYEHMIGRYLVLLRCKVTAGSSQLGVQLRAGINQTVGASDFPANSEIYISNTNYQLIELGEVVIPPIGYRQALRSSDAIKFFTMEIWAERLSGAGELDMDCLVLIPSEHFVYVSGTAVQYIVFDERPAVVITHEDDTNVALSYLLGIPNQALDFVQRDFYLPVEGGVLVVAARQNTAQVLTDQVSVTLQTYPRWLSFRGT